MHFGVLLSLSFIGAVFSVYVVYMAYVKRFKKFFLFFFASFSLLWLRHSFFYFLIFVAVFNVYFV